MQEKLENSNSDSDFFQGDTTLPGHIENQRFPGQARNSFTLEDLEQERVSFVHDVSLS